VDDAWEKKEVVKSRALPTTYEPFKWELPR